MTDSHKTGRHPQQADAAGFAPGDPNHPQNVPTLPTQQAVADDMIERDAKELRTRFPDAPPYAVAQLVEGRATRRIADNTFEKVVAVERQVAQHELEIEALKRQPVHVTVSTPPPPTAPPRAHRGKLPSLTEANAGDMNGALSSDDRLDRAEVAILKRKTELWKQAGAVAVIIVPVLMAGLGIIDRMVASRVSHVESAAKAGAAEAVRDAPPKILPAVPVPVPMTLPSGATYP